MKVESIFLLKMMNFDTILMVLSTFFQKLGSEKCLEEIFVRPGAAFVTSECAIRTLDARLFCVNYNFGHNLNSF